MCFVFHLFLNVKDTGRVRQWFLPCTPVSSINNNGHRGLQWDRNKTGICCHWRHRKPVPASARLN